MIVVTAIFDNFSRAVLLRPVDAFNVAHSFAEHWVIMVALLRLFCPMMDLCFSCSYLGVFRK